MLLLLDTVCFGGHGISDKRRDEPEGVGVHRAPSQRGPVGVWRCAEKVKLAEDRAPRLRIAHRLLTLRHEHEDVQPFWSEIVEKVRSDAVLAEAALRLVRP